LIAKEDKVPKRFVHVFG